MQTHAEGWQPHREARPRLRPTPKALTDASPPAELDPRRFTIGRYSDNELILFDEAAQESWIVYPPRSSYEFLKVRRPSAQVAIVEHHPWSPLLSAQDHPVDPRLGGCQLHGAACAAQSVIQSSIDLGYNPFL